MQQINNTNDQLITLLQHLFQLCACVSFLWHILVSSSVRVTVRPFHKTSHEQSIWEDERLSFFEFQYSRASMYKWQPHMLSNNRAISINKIDMLLVGLEFRSRRVLFASNSRILRSISYIHSFRSLPRYGTSSLLQFSLSQLNTVKYGWVKRSFTSKMICYILTYLTFPTNKRGWMSASRCRCGGFRWGPSNSYHNCCRQHCVFSPFLCTFTDLFHENGYNSVYVVFLNTFEHTICM